MSGYSTKPSSSVASASELAVSPAEGRRSRQRDRTALSCMLEHGPFREHHSGTVRDIHAGGARVKPACDPRVIDGLVRVQVGDQFFGARVAWKTERELGLRFVDPPDANDHQIAALQAVLSAMKGR